MDSFSPRHRAYVRVLAGAASRLPGARRQRSAGAGERTSAGVWLIDLPPCWARAAVEHPGLSGARVEEVRAVDLKRAQHYRG